MLASIDSTDSIYILFNFDAAENYLNYSSSKISRINPFEYINNNFFGVNRFKYLFGYGLGNCSYSNINIFNSTFATLNEGLSYQYYPHSFVTLETGYLGFISFTSIFIFNIIFSYKKRKINYFYSTLSIAMSCVALLSFFVSTTLINNFSYIVYFGVFIFPIYYYQTTKISKIR